MMTTSGQHHQVIHIRSSTSVTQGTSEQVSSPRGGGPDPKPQHNTPLPCAPPPAGAPLWSRADVRVGDESQAIAVKGLRCPLGCPRSDLGRLRMITHRSGTMPALACAGHSPPGHKGPVLLLIREPPRLRQGRRIPKRYVGAGGRGGLRAQLFEPHARAGGAGCGRGATSRYLPPASVAPGGGCVAARRAAPPLPHAGGIVHVRACVHACVRACMRAVRALMILPQVHLRKPCYDFYFL